MTTNKVGQKEQVNLNQFHVGLKRSEAKTKAQTSIFNALDKDKDGVIEKNEMQGVVQGKRKVNGKWVNQQFIKIKNLENGRSLVVDANGRQYVMAHDGIILKQDYVDNPEKYKKAIQQKRIQTRQTSEKLADEFYKIADENSGYSSMKKMQNLLDTKINSKNITSFLDAYDRKKTKKDDSSIIDTVTSEIGAGGSTEQRKVLMTIMNKLCEAAKNAGVSDENIKKAYKYFETSLNKEFAAKARRTNPKDMEKAIDFLRGEIAAKQTANVNKMSTKDAIKSFNASFIKENNSAQSAYNEAKGEGWSWSAKMGDTVCGWFGCNTIEEMEKKLGANAKAVKSLVSAKTEAEFKTRYKQVFGIEFDPQKIAAAEASQGNYIMAQGLSQGIKVYNKLLSNANNQTLSQFENSVKSTLKLNDEQFALFQKTVYANCKTDAEKKQALTLHMRNAQGQLSSQYNNLTRGKTLEQMGKDCELIAKSAFGTNDISKDIAQFTDNMATTEMIADITGDIVLTAAVSAIPGGAAWGSAKLAASVTKWGAKGAKVAKVLTKTANAFEKVKKFEQGTQYAQKAAQGSKTAKAANIASKTVSSAGNAAVGTAIYESSATNHSAEEIKNKCLTNGVYGAIGAGASELAPKLMQAFKINSNLANEIAEEIINAVGSLGVEAAKGGEYGTTDAAMDIVSGILMARLSHIGGGGKVHTNTPDVTSAKTKPSLSESDKLTKSQKPLDNGVVFSQRIIKDLDNPKVQGQVGDYMDNLLESVPTQNSKIKGSIELEADYLLPDGTLIARKSTGDTGELVWDEVTQKYKLKENESAIAFWIRDPDGNEHMLTATTPENREKAQQLINYCSTQEPIPRSQIDAVQKQHLDNLKSKNTQNSTSDTKIDNESKIMLDADGMPLAGGVSGSSSGGGFFSKIKNKISDHFSSETPIEKQVRIANEAKTQRAIDIGLNDAIAQGKVNSDIHDRINASGSRASISDATTGYAISDRLIDALERQKNGNTFVTRLSDNIDLNNISRHIENGGVCSVNGRLYINNNGEAVPIRMSQKTFDRLFDPMKLATMTQDGGTHICVATSQINSMLETPSGRTRLFTMLEDTGDGIKVNLNNGKSPIFFPNGKPVKMPGRFMTNAPDGVQMIEQAFMANHIKKSSTAQMTDISTLSADNLGKQSTEIMNRRTMDEAARDIGGSSQISFSTQKGNAFKGYIFKENVHDELEKLLNNFIPGQDVMICHWGGHAKSVVNYDPKTQIVTYRDPMSSGVDTQCTFTQFMNKGSHDYGLQISLQKAPSASASSVPKEAKTASKVSTPQPATTQETTVPLKPKEVSVTTSTSDFVSKTTNLTNRPLVVARTASGTPIGASVTNSNVIIIKDGKRTLIPIPKSGTSETIFETSTNTFLIIKNDNGKVSIVTSETPELPEVSNSTTQTAATSVQSKPSTAKKRVELTYEHNNTSNVNTHTNRTSVETKPISRPPLEIPRGAKLIDTVTIMGKQCRRIKMPNGEFLTEFGGKWKKL
ncbi:MAG: hypothetical protein ACI37Q_03620 [Candidatus Gastranaerophilaceae bacterium]